MLLSAAVAGIRELIEHLDKFVGSPEPRLAIHESASLSPKHRALLFPVSFSTIEPCPRGPRFAWMCWEAELQCKINKLSVLAGVASGHRHFGLVGSNAQFMVWVDEYDDLCVKQTG